MRASILLESRDYYPNSDRYGADNLVLHEPSEVSLRNLSDLLALRYYLIDFWGHTPVCQGVNEGRFSASKPAVSQYTVCYV